MDQPLTPEERNRRAAERLRDELRARKVRAFELMASFLLMGDDDLSNCGYRTREQAILTTMSDATKDVERMIRAHERKYPD